jgi:hypothetical protein
MVMVLLSCLACALHTSTLAQTGDNVAAPAGLKTSPRDPEVELLAPDCAGVTGAGAVVITEKLPEESEAALVLEAALEVGEAEAKEMCAYDFDAGTTSSSTTEHAGEQPVTSVDTSATAQISDSSSGASGGVAAGVTASEQGGKSVIAGSAAGAQGSGKAKRRRNRGGRKGKAQATRQLEQGQVVEPSHSEEQLQGPSPVANPAVRKPSYAAALMKSLLGLPDAPSPVVPEQSPRKANNSQPSSQPQHNTSAGKTRGGQRRQGKGASTPSNVTEPARPVEPPSEKTLGSAPRLASYAAALMSSAVEAGSTVVPTVIVSPVVSPGHIQQQPAPPAHHNKASKSRGRRNSNTARGKTSI